MLLIDGTFLIYRSYYRSVKVKQQFHIDTISHQAKIARNYFILSLYKRAKQYHQENVYIFFDSEKENFRYQLLPSYKHNRREKPPELLYIKNEIYRFLSKFRFWFQISSEEEADDLIASFVTKYSEVEPIFIYSGDADLAALVRPQVRLLLERNQGLQEITDSNFHCHFPIPPNKFADWKALQGDKSDSIREVRGISSEEAIHLLLSFGNLESFYENGTHHYLYPKMIRIKKRVLLNKKVAQLVTNSSVYSINSRAKINEIISSPFFPSRLKEKINELSR